jgi:hypothetical protein
MNDAAGLTRAKLVSSLMRPYERLLGNSVLPHF